MNSGWLVAYVALAAAVLLACGFLAGWLARGDQAEDQRLDAIEAGLTVRGRHAASSPRRTPSTGELAALYGREYPQSERQHA